MPDLKTESAAGYQHAGCGQRPNRLICKVWSVQAAKTGFLKFHGTLVGEGGHPCCSGGSGSLRRSSMPWLLTMLAPSEEATIPTTKRLTSNAPTECWWIKPPGAMFKIGWNC